MRRAETHVEHLVDCAHHLLGLLRRLDRVELVTHRRGDDEAEGARVSLVQLHVGDRGGGETVQLRLKGAER